MKDLLFWNIFILLILSSCDKENDFQLSKKPVNNPPGEFQIKLVSLSDSSAFIIWNTPEDPDSDTLNYSIRLNGSTIERNLFDTYYSFGNSLAPKTQYEVEITAFDGQDSSASKIQFATTILTFLKRYELGTDAELFNYIEGVGFVFARQNNEGTWHYDTEILMTDLYGNVLWTKRYESSSPQRRRLTRSLRVVENQIQLSISENSAFEEPGSNIIIDVLDFSGKKLMGYYIDLPNTNWVEVCNYTSIGNRVVGVYMGGRESGSEQILFQIDDFNTYTPIDTLRQDLRIKNSIVDGSGNLILSNLVNIYGGFGGLIKVTPDLSVAWEKSFNLPEEFVSYDMALNDEYIFVAGVTFEYPFNIIGQVIKTDHEGNVIWDRIIDAGGYETTLRAISSTADGGCVVAGDISLLRGNDFGIFKLSAEGEIEWQRSFRFFEDLGLNTVAGIVESGDGGYYLYGTVRHFWWTDQHYQFLAKLNSRGELTEVKDY